MGKVKVNGQEQEIATPALLNEVIKLGGVQRPEMVSVQVNGRFVEREAFGNTRIEDGDEVDFLYFMGGGAR